MLRITEETVQPFEKEHIDLVRKTAPECALFLKREDDTLPLAPGKAALYGSGARKTIKGGTGSGDVNVRHFVTVEEGMERAGFEIVSKAWLDAYDQVLVDARAVFVEQIKKEAAELGINAVMYGMGKAMPEPQYEIAMDAECDLAVYVLSRISGEGADRDVSAGDINLSETEIRDILYCSRHYKKFVLVLNVGGMVNLEPVMEVKNILLLGPVSYTHLSKTIEKRKQQAIEQKAVLLKNVESVNALKMNPESYHSDMLVSFSEAAVIYEDRVVSRPVSFQVRTGDRVFIEGKNGSGKSSLLKLLVGEPPEHTGIVTVGSGLRISYVPQDTSYLTGTLEEFAEKNNLEESLFKTVLRKMDFERVQFEKDMKEFSGGQKKKVLIAKSLCERAHLYVWDEPLNFIDVYSRMQIEQLIEKFSPTMLLVEHDMAFRDAVATKVIEI